MDRVQLSATTIALAALALGCSPGGSDGASAGARDTTTPARSVPADTLKQDTTAAPPSRGPTAAPGVVDNLVPLDSLDDLPYLMLDRHRTDVDGDGRDESVELWVDATRDARGRLALDDGQRWALVVRTDERIYRLFDEFVQLGQPRFSIMAPEGGGPPMIVLVVERSAGLLVQTFRWEPSMRGFERRTPVRLSGNRLYESPVH